jgi:capsular exopolysaccharide synthesis family protein
MPADLITLRDPRSPVAEAFRTLRTNLMLGNAGLHAVGLTAPHSHEHKSVALANLAVTFAQSGHRTILVDGDLRDPSQHTIWGLNSERGLMTMMTDDSAMSNPPLVETEVENLHLLPTGPLPQIPSDVLSSQRMGEIIGVLKARSDYVLFDTPPVLTATDAALLGNKLDGLLLVVRAGHSRREHVAQAKAALERVNVTLLGAVLTNAPSGS